MIFNRNSDKRGNSTQQAADQGEERAKTTLAGCGRGCDGRTGRVREARREKRRHVVSGMMLDEQYSISYPIHTYCFKNERNYVICIVR